MLLLDAKLGLALGLLLRLASAYDCPVVTREATTNYGERHAHANELSAFPRRPRTAVEENRRARGSDVARYIQHRALIAGRIICWPCDL